MTLVLELYGGPGTGKSTTAASVFAALKKADVNAELVPEYAKDWAWQERKIDVLDQPYIAAKPLHREARLLGKVDVIITDSPVRLGHFYTCRYGTSRTQHAVQALVDGYEAETAEQGHIRLSVFLHRRKSFNPEGRFENEQQAREIDDELRRFLMPFPCVDVEADTAGEREIVALVTDYLDCRKDHS